MGRSRGVLAATEDYPFQWSKRRRVASGGDNLECVVSEKRALYHCNYCNKDISATIRIKCAKCHDFDLCVECFSVGVEVTPHKSNHPYRVMVNLSFPLFHRDWNADEEMLLLEGIETYGLGNWREVAEHVETKTKVQCIDHYMKAYINSPCYSHPDMSPVIGKTRAELLTMAMIHGEEKKMMRDAMGTPHGREEGLTVVAATLENPLSPQQVMIQGRRLDSALRVYMRSRSPRQPFKWNTTQQFLLVVDEIMDDSHAKRRVSPRIGVSNTPDSMSMPTKRNLFGGNEEQDS